MRSAPEERDSDISTLLQLEPEASPIQQSTLADEQRRDDNLLPMIKYLEEGELLEDPQMSKKRVARSDQFVILEGVLYFVEVKKHTRKRAVVPAQLKQELIQKAHGGPVHWVGTSHQIVCFTHCHVPGGGLGCFVIFTNTVEAVHSVQ